MDCLDQHTQGERCEDALDRQLLERAAAGDSSAPWQLWERHQADLYRLCIRWMSGRREDAQDACSSAMLKVRQLLPSQAAQLSNPGGWLARVAFTVCMDLRRHQGRRARLEGAGVSQESADETPADMPTPEETFWRHELFDRVQRAIDELPTGLREPARLRFLESLSHQEIARRLALNDASVRKRIQYARGILARRLRPYLVRRAPPRRLEHAAGR